MLNFTYTARNRLRVAGASRLQRSRVEVNAERKQSLIRRVIRHLSVARHGNDSFLRLICSNPAPRPLLGRASYLFPYPTERLSVSQHPQPCTSQYLPQALSRQLTRPSTQSHNNIPQVARVNLSNSQEPNRKNHFIMQLALTPLTQLSSQITATISSRWPEPNVPPARRSAQHHQKSPLKTTRARARLPSKTTTAARLRRST